MAGSLRKLLKTTVTPFIDRDDAMFVWKGKTPPLLIGDFTGWDDRNPAVMVKSEPGIWTYKLQLPKDAYIEYRYLHDGVRIADPFNPRELSNGLGDYNNYFGMPDYKPTGLTRKNPRTPHGLITSHEVNTDEFILGKTRTVYLYQPAVTNPVPLIVIWDGQDYLKRAHLNIIVDNLIARGSIDPLALAFVSHGGQKTRTVEYAPSEATMAFLLYEVLPLAREELNLLDINAFPGAYGIMGASMGGLMALYTGVRLPHIFGNVLSQSGAFSWAGFETGVFDLLREVKKLPLKIWMDVGLYDLAGLLDSNRQMLNLLNQRGYPVIYREYHAGHNFTSWRNDIKRGLKALYGTDK